MVRILRLILTCSLLLISTPLLAQEVASEGWQVTERCLGELPYPTIPQSQWDFEGMIFSRNELGVRAIRTDVESSYFVALKGDNSFPSVGGFSPDGRWFAYPVGATRFHANSIGDNRLTIDALVVVSTDPNQQILRQILWSNYAWGGASGARAFPEIHWIDGEHFIAAAGEPQRGGIVNPFSDEFEEWTRVTWLGYIRDFSPDFSRAFYNTRREMPPEIQLYDVLNDTFVNQVPSPDVLWLPSSIGFLTVASQAQSTSAMLVLYNRDGEFVESIIPVSRIVAWGISPDSSQVAFIDQDHLYLANMENKQIYDTCLTIIPTNFHPRMLLAWSPDSQSIVFLYDGYPIILNTETLEMQILRYETGEIIGWYPLP